MSAPTSPESIPAVAVATALHHAQEALVNSSVASAIPAAAVSAFGTPTFTKHAADGAVYAWLIYFRTAFVRAVRSVPRAGQ